MLVVGSIAFQQSGVRFILGVCHTWGSRGTCFVCTWALRRIGGRGGCCIFCSLNVRRLWVCRMHHRDELNPQWTPWELTSQCRNKKVLSERTACSPESTVKVNFENSCSKKAEARRGWNCERRYDASLGACLCWFCLPEICKVKVAENKWLYKLTALCHCPLGGRICLLRQEAVDIMKEIGASCRFLNPSQITLEQSESAGHYVIHVRDHVDDASWECLKALAKRLGLDIRLTDHLLIIHRSLNNEKAGAASV